MVNGRSLESAPTTDHMNERDNLKRMRARMRTYDYINKKNVHKKSISIHFESLFICDQSF